MTWGDWGKRLGISVATGVAAAFLSAIVLAVIDLYLTGHGRPSITVPWIDWAPAGVHLSIADVILIFVSAATAILTFRAARGGP